MTDVATDPPSTAEPTFKDGESSFGSFYPKHYVLAVFPGDAPPAQAGAALDALRAAGFATDDLVSVAGADLVAHAADLAANQSAFTRLRAQWSRLYTDGSADTKALVALAARGAAFVLAYAPEDADVVRAADALRPLGPEVLRSYGAFTVTDM